MGELDLLRRMFDKLFITPAVSRETGIPPPRWVFVEEPRNASAVLSLALKGMGAGESEATVLALEKSLPVIIDDRRARKEAENSGARAIGTLGILLQAKKRGHLDEVGPFLDRLVQTGFRASERIRAHTLRQAGELS